MRRLNLKTLLMFSLILIYTLTISIICIDDVVKSYNLIINPIFWMLTFIIIYILYKDTSVRIKDKSLKSQMVLIIMLFYIIIYFLSGLLFGYSKSPYSHSVIGFIKNIWSFLIIIFFQEYARYKLINNCGKSKIFYILVTILFILIDINFYNFSHHFISGEEGFKYVSSVIIPSIASNMLLSYLAVIGGIYSTLMYRVPIIFVNLIVPIFPNLSWFLIALYDLILSFVCFMYIQYLHNKKDDRVSRRSVRKLKPIKNLPFLVTLVLFVSFVAGFFKYMPIAVMSNSMSNIINRGDLVVIEKYKDNEIKNLKEMDIIEYKLDKTIVIHRIIKIEKQPNGVIKYTTKGDNNEKPDTKPVYADQIIGKVKFKIPAIGYPIVKLNEFFDNTKPNVETGRKT